MIKAFSLILIVISPFISTAQNAPLTTIGSVESATPGSIQVPVTVTNFSNMGAIYLSIDYDCSVIQLTGATPHPQLPTFLHGDADLGTGFHRITLGWYGNGLSLPDGSAIMTLIFNYTSGYTELTFYDNGPSCEYADGDGYGLNDIPTGDYYFNGRVCGALSNPGPITGENEVCSGQSPVSYSVAPMVNASAYFWQVPDYAGILCGQNTNLILVEFHDNTVSGNVNVYAVNPCDMMSSSSVLEVTVHPLPVAQAGNNLTIPYGTSTTLNAAPGGSGSFSYHWSPEELFINPDVQDPITVNLTSSTLFTLLVTNLYTFCQDCDEVQVSVTGGPLTANPTATPDSVCQGGYAYLYAFASGGSENYTFSWTSDPPGWSSNDENPIVSPGATTNYALTVSDGINNVSETVVVFVDDEVMATISGTDTLCGSGASTVLTVDLTGMPPWDFVYKSGNQSVLISGQVTDPYSLVTGTAGDYTISYVQDAFCTGIGNGTGRVVSYPIPPAPVISLIETTLVSDACCGNQWYHNDTVIPGATGVSYTATESGKYYDIVTRFSCVSDTSNIIYVVIPGIGEAGKQGSGEAGRQGFELYPNPATDIIHGRLNMDSLSASRRNGRFYKDFTLEVFDVYGRLMRESFVPDGSEEIEVNVASLSSGLYILVIRTETATFAKKLVIK